jgi:hypothetical protein
MLGRPDVETEPDELRSIAGHGRRRIRARRQSLQTAVIAVIIGLAVMAAFSVLWVWDRGSERRAIRTLPDGERRALYERTLENLRSVCALPESGDLQSFCRQQAELIVDLPECDAACRDLARDHRQRPSR